MDQPVVTPHTGNDLASAKPSLGATIARNAAYVTLGTILLKLINFAYSLLVARRLGDTGLGQYATVVSFVGVISILAELGVSQYVMREIAREPSRRITLTWNLIMLRLVLAFASIGIATAGAAIYGYPGEIILGVALYSLTFFWSALQAPVETLLTAHEMFGYVTAMSVVSRLASLLLGAIVLLQGWGFLALIAVGLVAMMPPTLLGLWAVQRQGLLGRPVNISVRQWPHMIRAGLPFGVVSLALTISFSIDSVILSRFHPPEVVGWYSAAYGLSTALLFLFRGFNQVLVPSLAKAHVHNSKRVEAWYERTSRFIAVMSLPIAVGGMLIAEPLIRFLLTDQFLPAVPAFQILIWDVPVLMYASFCGNMTTVTGAEKSAARIYTTIAVANVLLNLVAIPRFGIIGASVVTVITDLIAVILFNIHFTRTLGHNVLNLHTARTMLAALLMGVCVWLVHSAPLLVQIAVGMVSYLAFVVVLRIFDQEERLLFARVSRKVLPVFARG